GGGKGVHVAQSRFGRRRAIIRRGGDPEPTTEGRRAAPGARSQRNPERGSRVAAQHVVARRGTVHRRCEECCHSTPAASSPPPLRSTRRSRHTPDDAATRVYARPRNTRIVWLRRYPHPAYHAFVHTPFWTGLRASKGRRAAMGRHRLEGSATARPGL